MSIVCSLFLWEGSPQNQSLNLTGPAYDVENATDLTPTGISRGAVVQGRYRCDEHLPPGHPLCIAGRGYEGPVPDAGA